MLEQIITAMQARLGITRDDEGAALVEYGLLVALIAVVCIGAVTLLGQGVSGTFTAITGSL